MAAFTTLGVLSLIGAGVNAYGQWKAGGAAAKAGVLERQAKESEAQLTDYNAKVADLQAEDAITRGAEEESNYRGQVKNLIAHERTGFAAGGIDVTTGTPVDVAADTAYVGELDALTIRNNAAREAWGFNVQAEDLRRQAAIQRKEGANAEAIGKAQRTAARFGAATTLATSAGSLALQKYGFDRAGASTSPSSGLRVTRRG